LARENFEGRGEAKTRRVSGALLGKTMGMPSQGDASWCGGFDLCSLVEMSAQAENHEYQDDFFSYINAGSLASARVVCPLLVSWFSPTSLLDVGSGAGAWCRIWGESGVRAVIGVDGDYVKTDSLLIEEENFERRDLSKSFDLNRRFDLVTSLEVAEHVDSKSAEIFVENLTQHGDVVMFSAAVPGQGGEFHVNEQPLSYWREKFAARGYRCFDAVRPKIAGEGDVEPWYRYNTLLYVKEALVAELPAEVLSTEVASSAEIVDNAPFSWRARNAIIRSLPQPLVDRLVTLKHDWTRKKNASA